MTPTAASCPPTIDTETVGFDQGALLAIRHALAALAPGESLRVTGTPASHDPIAWEVHLRGWCRQQGHALTLSRADDGRPLATLTPGPAGADLDATRRHGAQRTGASDPAAADAVAAEAAPGWGLAARGAVVEAGSPAYAFALRRRHELWADTAAELYRQAVAAQWDPATAVDWHAAFTLPDAVEDAVVQVMTYLIENENAALLVPARHLGQVHPHYREVLQCLAVQCADEARHVEVFTRRATLRGREPALSTAGGQASLHTLFEAPDFSSASFLLSVLGEGSFVHLLNFLHAHAPDPVTAQIARLAARDEARHVAFGMAHLEHRLSVEPDYRATLAAAIEQRHEALAATAGLNASVHDALILLAAGDTALPALARGHAAVLALQEEMQTGRRARLARLGFAAVEAERLASLHTRNFM